MIYTIRPVGQEGPRDGFEPRRTPRARPLDHPALGRANTRWPQGSWARLGPSESLLASPRAAIVKGGTMPFFTPDPTFYPSARLAMQAPAERLAFLATLNPTPHGRPAALCAVHVAPGAPTHSPPAGRVAIPTAG